MQEIHNKLEKAGREIERVLGAVAAESRFLATKVEVKGHYCTQLRYEGFIEVQVVKLKLEGFQILAILSHYFFQLLPHRSSSLSYKVHK